MNNNDNNNNIFNVFNLLGAHSVKQKDHILGN